MEEERRELKESESYENEQKSDFGYMNDLLKAYNESLAAKKISTEISEEKRAYAVSVERRISEMCSSIAAEAQTREIKELALMAKAGADDCIGALGAKEATDENKREYSHFPLPALLSRCVLLLNRALNALVRSGSGKEKAITLILSQLSALFAIAAIR